MNRDNRSAPSQQFSALRFRPRHRAAFGINCVVAAQRNGGIGSIRWHEADGGEIGGQKAMRERPFDPEGVAERFGYGGSGGRLI